MSGDASTPAQDQNVESNDVPATPDVDAGTPIDPVVEETPTLDTEIDPANRLQQLEQELNSVSNVGVSSTTGSIGVPASTSGVAGTSLDSTF
jgi:hypothetical protein